MLWLESLYLRPQKPLPLTCICITNLLDLSRSLSLSRAWLPLTGLLMQSKDSGLGYRSSFNSSLSAYLSIPSFLLSLLLSTPLSDLGFSVLQSQILHTRFLILIRKRIDQNLGFGLHPLNYFMTTRHEFFQTLRVWQSVDLPQKQGMH
jgi:hypothetical protein